MRAISQIVAAVGHHQKIVNYSKVEIFQLGDDSFRSFFLMKDAQLFTR